MLCVMTVLLRLVKIQHQQLYFNVNSEGICTGESEVKYVI
jgi:hypothetical protein